MRVADVYTDVKNFLGQTDATTVYWYLSEAASLLAQKGSWEVRKAYLELPTQSGNQVTLPSFVESVLKVNVDSTPSFSRDRIYEFSLNGPGSNTQRTDYSWEDRGFLPTLITMPIASRVLITGSAADVSLKVVIAGLDASNIEITETLIIQAGDVASSKTYSSLTQVSKDVTTNAISLYASADGTAHTTLLSTYQPYETQGQYRQIRLSKTGVTAHLLVLRKTAKVYTQDDFIPIVSKIGLLFMVKALVAYSRTDRETGKGFEEDAVRIATEAQQNLTAFIDLAKDTEMDSVRGLNYNNRDSIIMADVFDDIAKITGPIGQYKVFDKTTEALEALHNKGNWDGLTGYVDILTDGGSYVTFPRYVESPIAITLGGRPMFMRNKWFEFHLNGPGSDCNEFARAWDWVGDVVTIQPLTYVVQLIAIPDNNADDGKKITIYGLDDNQKPLMTGSAMGYTFIVDHTKVLPGTNDQKISRIDRITRESTVGFVRLTGFSTDQTKSVQLGYWYPDETEPQYMRIKLPRQSNWVRMRYRKRTLKISSLTDPIHLKNKLALVCMVRAVEERYKGNKDAADDFETKSVQYVSEEQMSRNPGENFSLQFDETCFGSNYILV
jgi:hypothetical protein